MPEAAPQPTASSRAAVGPAVTDATIPPRPLARRALLDGRQSSPTPVQRHPERAHRQYALAERAPRLGWGAEPLTILDADQGTSGAGSAAAHDPGTRVRVGFRRLGSAVGWGEVGSILALELSRLARHSAEGQRRRELAALAGARLADQDSLDEPRACNDRLVLGRRATISQVEWPGLQSRLQGARLSKVRRGELPLELPVGYVRGPAGRIAGEPDQPVPGAIRTSFAQFEPRGPGSAVRRCCRDHGLQVPRRRWGGLDHGQRVWVKPTYPAIYPILTNPAYAGA